MSACARSIQDGTMFASPASTTVRTSNGSTPSWSEWIDRVVERRADDRDVGPAGGELDRVRDPGQLHERRQPDVGGEIEVVVRLVRLVPAVARGEVDVALVVGTVGHGCPPEAAVRDARVGPARGCRLVRAPPVRNPPSSG